MIIILLSFYWCTQSDILNVKTFKEHPWKVQREYHNNREATIMINNMNNRGMAFLQFLKNKYSINNSDSAANKYPEHIRNFVQRMLKNYNPEVIIETNPVKTKDTSYTVDKGRKLYLCIRQENKPNLIHNIELLSFIIFHEMTHMGDLSWGHEPSFWHWFKFVLEEAIEAGLYKPVNYMLHPEPYCGMDITYNPLYDNELADVRNMNIFEIKALNMI